jgi:hypothetical protein
MAAGKKRTKQQIQKILDEYAKRAHLTITDAAAEMGMSYRALAHILRTVAPAYGLEVPNSENTTTLKQSAIRSMPKTHELVNEIPDDDLPIEEIIEMRKREFEQKKAYEEATKLIRIKIKIPGPIGILHFGDPHVDDDGTDIGAAFAHAELTTTVEGLYGANVGDTTNAWVGRLARLYAEQNMGRKRALKVAEHFIRSTNWLYMVGGNHDGWAGEDDPIKWIARQMGALYRPSEARIKLEFPEGESLTINARHDFSGHSQWNPAHGVMKSIQMGSHDELSTCGHKHVSGYGVLKHPQDGTVCHALQVASYKRYDRFAREKGFRDQSLSPCAVTIISPHLQRTHPDRVKVFWDAEEGARHLQLLRTSKT